MHSLGIVQWNSTRRDHSGNPGGVSGLGLVSRGSAECQNWEKRDITGINGIV